MHLKIGSISNPMSYQAFQIFVDNRIGPAIILNFGEIIESVESGDGSSMILILVLAFGMPMHIHLILLVLH